MNLDECFKLLEIDRPKVTGKTQTEVDERLQEWKDTTLKAAYRKKALDTHPDAHPDDPEAANKFKAVQSAFERIGDIKVNLKRPSNQCPKGHPREPKTAKYCHECGYAYDEEPLITRLRAAGFSSLALGQLELRGDIAMMRRMTEMDVENRIKYLLLMQKFNLA